jgi:hypothetical protein
MSPDLFIIMFLALLEAISQRGGNLSTAPTTAAAMDARLALDVDVVDDVALLSPAAAHRTVLGLTIPLTPPLCLPPPPLLRVPTKNPLFIPVTVETAAAAVVAAAMAFCSLTLLPGANCAVVCVPQCSL